MLIQKSAVKSIIWFLIFTFLGAGAVPGATACGDGCCCSKTPYKKSSTHQPLHHGLHADDAVDADIDELGLRSYHGNSVPNTCCPQGAGEAACHMEPGAVGHVLQDVALSSPRPETPSVISLVFVLPETVKLEDISRPKEAFLPLKTSLTPLYLYHLSFLI